ncbi:MAG: hypothetical protein J0H92_19390 [Sphingobacteriales bacterium]|mgnify:CR=1 FL=1|nr:hypothetical protein [Sphingobacteriales bacterium]OJW32087.1 MAG: hypothetical protein BGO54_16875 [Sphingobacteriales bacterium 46-32]
MDDSENIDPLYIKRFNEGYLLASNEPSLAKSLASLQNDSLEVRGLKAGIEQRFVELEKEKRPQWLKEHSENKKTIDDFTKDIEGDNRPNWLKGYRENFEEQNEPETDKDDF